MDTPIIPRVVEMCSQTFPHGVALLLYMLENGIFGFSMLKGDLEKTRVTVSLLCLTMCRWHADCTDNPSATENMEEVFKEIGQVVRVK